MISYTTEIEGNESGEEFVTFPQEMLNDLGWTEGDILSWDIKGVGIVLHKINEGNVYDPLDID
tara:strand:+ start:381 stop:569 length:189 start_codon:yes stop_codon:yes gene_type:complete